MPHKTWDKSYKYDIPDKLEINFKRYFNARTFCFPFLNS